MDRQPLRIALIDCGSKSCPSLFKILEDAGANTVLVTISEAGKYPFDSVDGIIISGGPHLFTDENKGTTLLNQFSFIRKMTLPILGVCLGHQAIGLNYGASVFPGKKITGEIPLSVISPTKILSGIEDKTLFREDHREGISLPKHFRLLASSAEYKIEAMAHEIYPIFGVQFHPEISGAKGVQLISNYLDIVVESTKVE